MKLRIQGNSLRLRLSQSELTQFAAHGTCEDHIDFPGKHLRFGLQRESKIHAPLCTFDKHGIWVYVPTDWADTWIHEEEVGFSHEQVNDSGETLHLLVEKDFQCLHRKDVDQSDLFANPLS